MFKISDDAKDWIGITAVFGSILVGGAATTIGGEAAAKPVMLIGSAAIVLFVAGYFVWAIGYGIYEAFCNPEEAILGMIFVLKLAVSMSLFVVSVMLFGALALVFWFVIWMGYEIDRNGR